MRTGTVWGWVTVDGARTERDLEAHTLPAETRRAITTELEAFGHLGWHHVLELRANAGVGPRDIAAFIVQTGAQLVLEPRYRITAPR